ncbi:hypothetical protein DSCOOX_02150 [Desulfosarcina ovata subsp. ovata]|uniref:Uncharacterized protein n=1 Tax=Desulfosarcina ovata subsp. ovata TaxID=2752305 RepID=A0A5K8A3B0_9BACT|nr:hypothetical protein [Desulfosarcina ovata]BBO87035.1 hypothetical protein DSCOOX_02150 [Desulfosarcina ovata subsp. ovata]
MESSQDKSFGQNYSIHLKIRIARRVPQSQYAFLQYRKTDQQTGTMNYFVTHYLKMGEDVAGLHQQDRVEDYIHELPIDGLFLHLRPEYMKFPDYNGFWGV